MKEDRIELSASKKERERLVEAAMFTGMNDSLLFSSSSRS